MGDSVTGERTLEVLNQQGDIIKHNAGFGISKFFNPKTFKPGRLTITCLENSKYMLKHNGTGDSVTKMARTCSDLKF